MSTTFSGWRRKASVFACFIAISSIILIWWWSPYQRVRRLRNEIASLPGGNIDIFYTGRSPIAISNDFQNLGTDAVPALIDWLENPRYPARHCAAKQLGKIGDRRALEPLLTALNDADNSVRYSAVEAIGRIGDVGARERILRCLESNDADLRSMAVKSLGLLGDKRSCPRLMAFLYDFDLTTRANAAIALGLLGDQSALLPLTEVAEHDADPWVRREAAESIRRLEQL